MGLLGTFVFWLLVLQNAGVVLLMRYTRATPGEGEYLAQVVVLCIECTKLHACTAALVLTGEGFQHLCRNFVMQSITSAVPALLYLVQNNVIFFALARVDAPTFQVLYQSKIVLDLIEVIIT